MDNYLTNIVGKGMIFPIQLTRNERVKQVGILLMVIWLW